MGRRGPLIEAMSTKELRVVLKFIQEKGACHESEVWSRFVRSDTIEERARVTQAIETLNLKELIEHGYNEDGELVVKDSHVIYGS